MRLKTDRNKDRLYLLDEHIPPVYQTQLLYHEPSLTVLAIGRVKSKGILNKQLQKYASTSLIWRG